MRRSKRTGRLKPRGRIGVEWSETVQPEAVARARPDVCNPAEETVSLGFKEEAIRGVAGGVFDYELDPLAAGCPNPEVGGSVCSGLGPYGQAPIGSIHGGTRLREPTAYVGSGPGFVRQVTTFSAVPPSIQGWELRIGPAGWAFGMVSDNCRGKDRLG